MRNLPLAIKHMAQLVGGDKPNPNRHNSAHKSTSIGDRSANLRVSNETIAWHQTSGQGRRQQCGAESTGEPNEQQRGKTQKSFVERHTTGPHRHSGTTAGSYFSNLTFVLTHPKLQPGGSNADEPTKMQKINELIRWAMCGRSLQQKLC